MILILKIKTNSSKVSERLCKIYSRNAYFQIINCTYIWIINCIKENISHNQVIIASASIGIL